MAIPKRLRYRPRVTEAFPFLAALNAIPGVRAGWVERVPDLPITGDRDEAMRQLRPLHEAAVAEVRRPCRAMVAGGTGPWKCRGRRARRPEIIAPDGLPVVPGVDGLITGEPGVVLAIYVADCGAIWLADRKTGAIGLLHSGKKGTATNIFQVALDRMAEHFGTRPEDVTAVLGPCIRPPDYDVDFAAGDRQPGRARREWEISSTAGSIPRLISRGFTATARNWEKPAA